MTARQTHRMTPVSMRLEDFTFVHSGLKRPESIAVARDGTLYLSHEGVGIKRIAPDGESTLLGQLGGEIVPGLTPNGIALERSGSVLLANIAEPGGVWRASAARGLEPVVMEADGVPLGAANFVLLDREGRIWISVSTRTNPRFKAFNPQVRDGFIVLMDDKGARIVADGIGFTNECRICNEGRHLYVSETFSRRITRFPILGDRLGQGEVFATFGHGTYPDGCVFDSEGSLWLTSVVSNRIFRIAPDGSHEMLLEDCDATILDEVETAYQNGTLDRALLYKGDGKVLSHIASIAFGGEDLRTIFLGSLKGDSIPTMRLPVAGVKPVHWD